MAHDLLKSKRGQMQHKQTAEKKNIYIYITHAQLSGPVMHVCTLLNTEHRQTSRRLQLGLISHPPHASSVSGNPPLSETVIRDANVKEEIDRQKHQTGGFSGPCGTAHRGDATMTGVFVKDLFSAPFQSCRHSPIGSCFRAINQHSIV